MSNSSLSGAARMVIAEIQDVRGMYSRGKIGSEQVRNYVYLFNASSTAIRTAVSAESWEAELLKRIKRDASVKTAFVKKKK